MSRVNNAPEVFDHGLTVLKRELTSADDGRVVILGERRAGVYTHDAYALVGEAFTTGGEITIGTYDAETLAPIDADALGVLDVASAGKKDSATLGASDDLVDYTNRVAIGAVYSGGGATGRALAVVTVTRGETNV